MAAFEQRLQKPILVSKYCHLTGALGTALTLHDERQAAADHPPATRFAGLGLWQTAIPVRSEVCDLCTNHCKLSVAEVAGKTVAYGFLCGRDYDTLQYVRTASGAFDLMGERRKALRVPRTAASQERPSIGRKTGVFGVSPNVRMRGSLVVENAP